MQDAEQVCRDGIQTLPPELIADEAQFLRSDLLLALHGGQHRSASAWSCAIISAACNAPNSMPASRIVSPPRTCSTPATKLQP